MAEEGHRRALEVQGRPRRRSARRALLPVDAPAARVAAGGPRSAGVHPEPQGRALPGGGLHLHAEGPGQGAAARRDADRLRLLDPHRRRPPVRRRARQRQDGAAAHAPQERRHRRDRHAGGAQAEPRLAELRRRRRARATRSSTSFTSKRRRAPIELGRKLFEKEARRYDLEPEDASSTARRSPRRSRDFARRQDRRSVRGDRLRQALSRSRCSSKLVPADKLREKPPEGAVASVVRRVLRRPAKRRSRCAASTT